MIQSIVIVGGGTAGWITAGILAAKHCVDTNAFVKISVVESPDIPTIGVGEGTWPSMVNTLKSMGISENDFIRECDVSLKQGIQFERWVTGSSEDIYYHPFSYPHVSQQGGIVAQWLRGTKEKSFAESVTTQCQLAENFLAPKQLGAPEYSALENYAYHLDAGKFANFLNKHCVERFNVNHIVEEILQVQSDEKGDIKSLVTRTGKTIAGDLFIDCSGVSSILLGKHYQVPFISCRQTLLVDRALAVQLPYKYIDAPIASMTRAVAQEAGWIWDIGLPGRRGLGHAFSSEHISTERAAEQLLDFIQPDLKSGDDPQFKEINFNPGYRKTFWKNNCVAVGMSSGFVEPLEASAIGMIELSARMIAEYLPVSQDGMKVISEKFNEIFLHRWKLIINFIKLHYCISQRTDSEFWIDNQSQQSIPETLQDLLCLWKSQPPIDNGLMSPYDMFPVASYQYILYGMGFLTQPSHLNASLREREEAIKNLQIMLSRTQKILKVVPTNRQLITEIISKAR